MIEDRLGSPCDFLCWPKGRFTDEAVRTAKAAGYKGLFTTKPGVAEKGGDPYMIKRIVVKDNAGWLKSRLKLYTSPVLSNLYLRLKG
jgi:peptidoglycan/xylan/chitin deacetylase (PgdA/CDA1 family)